jgi:predicted nuclease of predicted toxin-antitoxin system
MNLVADEGIDLQVAERLRNDGHDVLYVAEMDPGIDDEAVLAVANERNAVLLTADKDFGELIFRWRKISAGALLLRLAGLSPTKKAHLMSSVLREHASDISAAFTVVSPGMVRIRPQAP